MSDTPLTRATHDAAAKAMEAEIARLNPELGKRAALLALELDATRRALGQAQQELAEERRLRRSETRDLYEQWKDEQAQGEKQRSEPETVQGRRATAATPGSSGNADPFSGSDALGEQAQGEKP